MIRVATASDIPGMHRVRLAVRENRLVSRVISEADYRSEMLEAGRGWVAEADGCVVAFAVGNAQSGNIWALFTDPAFEGRGFGRALHDAMVAWLWSRGLARLWLTTEAGTRAARFYARAGWRAVPGAESGEQRFEMERPRRI